MINDAGILHKKLGEIAGTKRCYVTSATRPLGHLSCMDFDMFETVNVNQLANAYSCELFRIDAGVFSGPKNANMW